MVFADAGSAGGVACNSPAGDGRWARRRDCEHSNETGRWLLRQVDGLLLLHEPVGRSSVRMADDERVEGVAGAVAGNFRRGLFAGENQRSGNGFANNSTAWEL